MLRMPLTHIQRQKLNFLQWGYQVQEVESSGLSHTVVVFDLLFCSFIFFFFGLYPSIHLKEGLVLVKMGLKISSNPLLFYWVK